MRELTRLEDADPEVGFGLRVFNSLVHVACFFPVGRR